MHKGERWRVTCEGYAVTSDEAPSTWESRPMPTWVIRLSASTEVLRAGGLGVRLSKQGTIGEVSRRSRLRWADASESEGPGARPLHTVCDEIPPPIRSATLEANSSGQTVFEGGGEPLQQCKTRWGPEMKKSGSGGLT